MILIVPEETRQNIFSNEMTSFRNYTILFYVSLWLFLTYYWAQCVSLEILQQLQINMEFKTSKWSFLLVNILYTIVRIEYW